VPSKEFIKEAYMAFLEAWEIKREVLDAGFGEKFATESAEDYFEACYPTQAS
jgi:hypothetical protein